jgi:trimeric autotransporter adhesin
MSGFKLSTGADLDTVFQPRTATDPSAQYIAYTTSDGKSLSERYLPYTTGNPKAIATGYKVVDASDNSLDLNNYYSKILTFSWSGLSTGINNTVNAIYALNANNVYVGGKFTTAGGGNANNIARWDGTNWSNLGGGINTAETYERVIVIYALDANNVYVGGRFSSFGGANASSNIVRWNGSSWVEFGGGVLGDVLAIYALNANNVYVGGTFNTAGQGAGTIYPKYIARWTGSGWSYLGSGVQGQVYAIYALNANNVYIGGSFNDAGGVTGVNHIARWDGTNWNTMGGGMSVTSSYPRVLAIYALDTSNVYVGGYFTSAGGVTGTSYIARWDGTKWNAMGSGIGPVNINTAVYAIYAQNANNVYAGGYFNTPGNNIVKWNGSSWSALGGGLTSAVSAMSAVDANNIYVGGSFNTAGSVSAVRVAKGSYS